MESNDDLSYHIERLNGIVMVFAKNNQEFKIYRSVDERKADKEFNDPIKISEYDFELLEKLITCSEPNVQYNSSRIINAKILNDELSESQTSVILDIISDQLAEENNIRVKALITNILKKRLNISREKTVELLFEAFKQEEDEFWKFELLSIILGNVGNKGLGEKALSIYKKENILSQEQNELISKIISQVNLFSFLSNIIDDQQEQIIEEDEKIEVEEKRGLLDNIIEYFVQNVDLSKQSPKVILAHLGQFFNSYNQGGIKYDSILEELESLEKIIGEIPAFAVIEGLPEVEQEKRYEYLLFELLYHSLSSMEILLTHSVRNIPTTFLGNILSLAVPDFFKNISNETLVTRYCREWEIQYSNLIKPIFDKIIDQKCLPCKYKKKKKFSYQNQIDIVRKFTLKNLKLNIFDFLTDPLNARLRNSLVHYNYYFDNDGDELVYYRIIKGKARIDRLPLNDFQMKVYRLIVHRNISIVRIAKKLCQELGIEWRKRTWETND